MSIVKPEYIVNSGLYSLRIWERPVRLGGGYRYLLKHNGKAIRTGKQIVNVDEIEPFTVNEFLKKYDL